MILNAWHFQFVSALVICTINTGHQVRLLSIPVVIHELLMFEFPKLIHVQKCAVCGRFDAWSCDVHQYLELVGVIFG
ncbi:hypothetical protein CGJ06_23820 [Vibrio parahaemolyticus]|nr:hypothetical protein CGJ06_23820 [Vibrio parahaemolyticus]